MNKRTSKNRDLTREKKSEIEQQSQSLCLLMEWEKEAWKRERKRETKAISFRRIKVLLSGDGDGKMLFGGGWSLVTVDEGWEEMVLVGDDEA